jgi:hypothetical protein
VISLLTVALAEHLIRAGQIVSSISIRSAHMAKEHHGRMFGCEGPTLADQHCLEATNGSRAWEQIGSRQMRSTALNRTQRLPTDLLDLQKSRFRRSESLLILVDTEVLLNCTELRSTDANTQVTDVNGLVSVWLLQVSTY